MTFIHTTKNNWFGTITKRPRHKKSNKFAKYYGKITFEYREWIRDATTAFYYFFYNFETDEKNNYTMFLKKTPKKWYNEKNGINLPANWSWKKFTQIFIKFRRKRNESRVGRNTKVYWYIPTSDSNNSSIRYLFDGFKNPIFLYWKKQRISYLFEKLKLKMQLLSIFKRCRKNKTNCCRWLHVWKTIFINANKFVSLQPKWPLGFFEKTKKNPGSYPKKTAAVIKIAEKTTGIRPEVGEHRI